MFIVFATLEVICIGGILYGWTSLDGIFKNEGFFSSHCGNHSDVMKNETAGHDPNYCGERLEQLNLVFLVSASLICFTNFPAGIGLDRFGPWKMRIIAM